MDADNTERGTQPACNQCRTRKVRCRREQPVCSNCAKSGLPCDFNTRPKRVNHTKQLAEDFSQLSGRLERIDDTLNKINQHLQRQDTSTLPSGSLSGSDKWTVHSQSQQYITQDAFVASDRVSETPATVRPWHSIDSSGTEQYYGSTSFQALMQSTRTTIDTFVITQQQKSRGELGHTRSPRSGGKTVSSLSTMLDALRVIDTGYPLTEYVVNTEVGTESPVMTLPLSLAQAGVEAYLSNEYDATPLLDAATARAELIAYYSGGEQVMDEVLNLRLTSMAVLGFGPGIQRAKIADDTMQKLLENCRRGMERSKLILRPQASHLKTLLLLTFVAAEHFLSAEFEQCISQSCRMLRDIGVEHRRQDYSYMEDADRQKVFWTLYALDKQRAFLSGKACELYLFDCDVVMPASSTMSLASSTMLARAHLFAIWEEIWTALYCAAARRHSQHELSARIAHLDLKLKNWYEQYKLELERSQVAQEHLDTSSSLKIELQYLFHFGQLLVHRCATSDADISMRQDSARAALRIPIGLSMHPSSHAHTVLLKRLLRYNSPLPFFELHHRLLHKWDEHALTDLELMVRCFNAVHGLTSHSGDQIGYFSRLAAGMHWALSINKVLCFGFSCPIPISFESIPPEIPVGYHPREGRRIMVPMAVTLSNESNLAKVTALPSEIIFASTAPEPVPAWSFDVLTLQREQYTPLHAMSMGTDALGTFRTNDLAGLPIQQYEQNADEALQHPDYLDEDSPAPGYANRS